MIGLKYYIHLNIDLDFGHIYVCVCVSNLDWQDELKYLHYQNQMFVDMIFW